MVSFQLDFATIASILAVLMGVATLTGLAIKAGERREAMEQLKRDIKSLQASHAAVDDQSREDGKALSGIQATLDALVNSVKEVRTMIMVHVNRDIGGGG